MRQYLDTLKTILNEGEDYDAQSERTGTGTRSIFGGLSFRHDLKNGYSFPLLTTKQVFWKTALYELLWFLSGSNDIRKLWLHRVKIWDGNYYSDFWQNNHFFEQFSVGKNYSTQWRNFHGVDQLVELIKNMKKDPFSRRHIVTMWNPPEVPKTALPPCPILYHFKINKNYELDMIMTQRSCDMFLGIPFNIANSAFLMMLVSDVLSLHARYLTIELHDAHIYLNHLNQVEEQLSRDPYPLPRVVVSTSGCSIPITDYHIGHFEVKNYVYHRKIEAPMAV